MCSAVMVEQYTTSVTEIEHISSNHAPSLKKPYPLYPDALLRASVLVYNTFIVTLAADRIQKFDIWK